MVIRSYRELEVWQKAMDLVVLCYQVAEKFPKGEMYGLVVQLQRAVVSVPANIAEGREGIIPESSSIICQLHMVP